jgi:lipoic acid synthetase
MAKPKLTGPRPEWLKVRIRADETFDRVTQMINDLSLHTVCQEARCPNIFECWGEGTATFMILGDVCTRHCGFCAVTKGKPLLLDPDEPRHVGEAVRRLGVRHAASTVTSCRTAALFISRRRFTGFVASISALASRC